MHKDQARLREKFVPFLMDRLVSDNPEAVEDCTVVNRLFIQGPDPLFVMATCPDEFRRLCILVGLTPDEGQEAITAAHWKGPGVLLEGTGLDPHLKWLDDMETLPKAHRAEILWLLLASLSDCTEEGYQSEVGLKDRVRRAMKAGIRLRELLDEGGLELVGKACRAAEEFIRTTTFTPDPRFGVPMSNHDHSFYVGYKQGHKCIAVQTPGGVTFYGTTPDSSLAAHGVEVDKEITPQFGLIFPKA